jgi:hypothetical protein
MKCRLFHYIRTGVECAERMNLRYVQEIGHLECYRTGICGCLKHFENNNYKVTIKEINKNIDLIFIDKKLNKEP